MMASTLKKRWTKPVPDKLPILLLGMAAEHQQCGADDLLLGQNSHFLMPACPPRVNAW